MSKTPRTDKWEITALGERHYNPIKCVRSGFARQLETELAEARAEIERLNTECKQCSNLAARLEESNRIRQQNMVIDLNLGHVYREKILEALWLGAANVAAAHGPNSDKAKQMKESIVILKGINNETNQRNSL